MAPDAPDPDGRRVQVFVFQGCLTLLVGNEEKRVAAGEFYMFASRHVHGYRNDGDVAVRFVRNVVI